MNIFNEEEMATAKAIADPAVGQLVLRRKKKKVKCKEDLSFLPKRIDKQDLTKARTTGNGCLTRSTVVWNTNPPSREQWIIMWSISPQRISSKHHRPG